MDESGDLWMTQGALGSLKGRQTVLKKVPVSNEIGTLHPPNFPMTLRFHEPEEARAAGRQEVAGDVHRVLALYGVDGWTCCRHFG